MAQPRWTAGPHDAGLRLDKYLADAGRLGSRAKAAAALERGKVFINDKETSAADASRRLADGDVVRVWMDRPGSATRRAAIPVKAVARDLPIVYEDDVLIVLNKPPGVLAVPLERRGEARSVYDEVKEYLKLHRRPRPFTVHRIDRDTSGLVVFAKTAAAQAHLKDQFKRHLPRRVYHAVVYGYPTPPAGTWRDRLVWDERALIQKETRPHDPRGKEAVSHYRVLERLAGASLLEVTLVTGRQNQIRIQARLRGHTLVGERRYTSGPDTRRPIAFPRQALHAFQLAFAHPLDGRDLRFEAPLPEDMRNLVMRLRRQPAD